jgi:hypothetical protein
MRTLLLAVLCCVFACAVGAQTVGGAGVDTPKWLSEKRVTVVVENLPLAQAIDALFKDTGIKYRVLSELSPNARVSLSYTDVPLTYALNACLAGQGLTYRADGETLVIDVDKTRTPAASTTQGGSSGSGGWSGSGGSSTSGSSGGYALSGGSSGSSSSSGSGSGGSSGSGSGASSGSGSALGSGGGARPGMMGGPLRLSPYGSRPDDPTWLADKRVTVSIQNVSLAEAVDRLLREAGVKYRVVAELPTSVTVSVSYANAPIAGALRSLLACHGSTFYAEGNSLVIDVASQAAANSVTWLADKRVTTSIQNLPLAGAIDKIFRDAGVSYRIAAELPQNTTVSLSYSNAPLADALTAFLRCYGLTYYADGNTLVIDSIAAPHGGR